MQSTWVHDFGNFKMMFDRNDEDISKQIENFGWYEDERFELETFRKKLKLGMNFLDLGANIGFYSLFARSILGPESKIISFEPFKNNVKLIKSSIQINGFENINVVEAAVSDHEGDAELFLSSDATTEHSLVDFKPQDSVVWNPEKIKVKIISVDKFLEENFDDLKIDFIKMDVEASEFFALKGMQKTIDKNEKIKLLTEFWPKGLTNNHSDPEKFLDYLANMGFSIFHLDSINEQIEKVTPAEMINIAENRSEESKYLNETMKEWGWYTNLLCEKC